MHNGRPEIIQRLIEEGRIDAEEAIVPAASPEDAMIPWKTAAKKEGTGSLVQGQPMTATPP
jgi:hypothetical protein